MTVPRSGGGESLTVGVGKTESSIARGRYSWEESRVGVTRLSWAAWGGEGEGRREGTRCSNQKGKKITELGAGRGGMNECL